MKTLKLDCPGIAIRVRPCPDFGAQATGLLKTDSIVDVLDEPVNGFYELADGSGFVITGDEGICWHELPPEVAQALDNASPANSAHNNYYNGITFASTPPGSNQSTPQSAPQQQFFKTHYIVGGKVMAISPSNNTQTTMSTSPSMASSWGSSSSISPPSAGMPSSARTPATANQFSPTNKQLSTTTPPHNGIATLPRTGSDLSNKSAGSTSKSVGRARNLSVSSANNEFSPSYAYTQVRYSLDFGAFHRHCFTVCWILCVD
jgi:hypothetical protein